MLEKKKSKNEIRSCKGRQRRDDGSWMGKTVDNVWKYIYALINISKWSKFIQVTLTSISWYLVALTSKYVCVHTCLYYVLLLCNTKRGL